MIAEIDPAVLGGLFGLLAFFSLLLMCVIARRAIDRLEPRDGFEDYDLREAAKAEEVEL